MPKSSKKASRRVIRSPSLGSGSSRTPSPPLSNYEYCTRSDTPEEDWGEDGDDEIEWPVKEIVGEEILLNREVRYQVEWDGWKRADGTTTTWAETIDGSNNVLEMWKATRESEKQRLLKSSEIDLTILNEYRPHNIRTAENAVAFEEKRDRSCPKKPKFWDEWILEETRAQLAPVELPTSIPDMTRKRKRSESNAPTSRASSSRASESDMTLVASPGPSNKRRNPFELKWPSMGALSILQKSFDESIKGTGAARVQIINEIDDEEIPQLVNGFKYLENNYRYDMGVPEPTENSHFILGCDCVGGCDDASSCLCISELPCVDEEGHPYVACAYDKNGLFLFRKEGEVIECNKKCSCSRSCRNRVSQRPRKIPLEVFKTLKNGWGVRSPVRIVKGTVLGIYTGRVIKRDALKRLTPEERNYTFDLDIRENEPGLEYYSVCAYAEGNWTRFVNHSCSPNTEVFSAVIDNALAANMPHIVFVASENIPAREEITLDYNPREKGKKGKKRTGDTRCFCGTKGCRKLF